MLTNTHVTKVLFSGKQAIGVEISRHGKKGRREQLKASKEVILSAGVINSPQLLKLSGVGPAAELRQHAIPLVQELPGVGENLQDHPDVILRYASKAGGSLVTVPSWHSLQFFSQVLFAKNFIYTPTDVGGFIKSSPDQPIPDLQLQFAAVRMQPHGAEEVPGMAVQTDAQLKSWIKQNVETVYHTAGSCKMGNDAMAVVNAKLEVQGLTGLRVIDASIMPTITGSNIHAPTVMIAEKGANYILQQYQALCSNNKND